MKLKVMLLITLVTLVFGQLLQSAHIGETPVTMNGGTPVFDPNGQQVFTKPALPGSCLESKGSYFADQGFVKLCKPLPKAITEPKVILSTAIGIGLSDGPSPAMKFVALAWAVDQFAELAQPVTQEPDAYLIPLEALAGQVLISSEAQVELQGELVALAEDAVARAKIEAGSRVEGGTFDNVYGAWRGAVEMSMDGCSGFFEVRGLRHGADIRTPYDQWHRVFFFSFEDLSPCQLMVNGGLLDKIKELLQAQPFDLDETAPNIFRILEAVRDWIF